MSEYLRMCVAIPAAVVCAVWEWLTHDEFEDFITDQRERLNRMAAGKHHN